METADEALRLVPLEIVLLSRAIQLVLLDGLSIIVDARMRKRAIFERGYFRDGDLGGEIDD